MRVLIVEDEPNLGRQLRATLEGAGYAIDLATDGEDGHYLGSTETYDAIIPDLGLPECFPPALRFAVEADGTLTDRRSDLLAADARGWQDGWSNSRLKLIAGTLGIGFDDLRRR